MKRHVPRPSGLQAAQRIFIHLACMTFTAALLSHTSVAHTAPAVASVSEPESAEEVPATVPTEPSAETRTEPSGPSGADTVGAASGTGSSTEPATASALAGESAESLWLETGETRQAGQELTPFLTFAAIEKAWNMGWADSVMALFPEERITLRLEANVPEEAFFSRMQAGYILKDAFSYTLTESFEFLEFKYDKGGEEPPYGNAQWTFRREPSGKIIVEKVHVTLRKDDDHWLISEIRILD